MNYSRIISTAFLLGLFSACSSHQARITVMEGDSALTLQGKFQKHHGVNFSGWIDAHDENGVLKSRSQYVDGLQEGDSFAWYPDGHAESVRSYHEGEKDGVHKGWWPNGNLRFEYHFSQGIYHGTFSEWYENGKPLNLFTYYGGKEVRAVGWRENGRTYINFEMRNGRKYGLTNARLCYSLYDEKGIYKPANNP